MNYIMCMTLTFIPKNAHLRCVKLGSIKRMQNKWRKSIIIYLYL